MNKIVAIIFMLLSVSTYGQIDNRINQIRDLYKEYNENLLEWDTYEVKWNTAGSYPSAVIYTDYEGKLLIKTEDANEFESVSTAYYFHNDTIQFIFSKSYRLTTHWGSDTVRYELLELRYYFDKGEVIKTLKKQFNGIEGQDDTDDISRIANKTINHLEDVAANWIQFEQRIKDLIKFYDAIENII